MRTLVLSVVAAYLLFLTACNGSNIQSHRSGQAAYFNADYCVVNADITVTQQEFSEMLIWCEFQFRSDPKRRQYLEGIK